MVELYKKSKMGIYVEIALLVGSLYFLAATPYIIGKASENSTCLEQILESADYSR